MTAVDIGAAGAEAPAHGISFREALRVWAKVAALSFGGPAGQIAVMHRILVEEKKWIGEARFLHALNYCMLLPGPEAQQLATYIGWLLHRTKGGLAAGLLFVLPGFVCLMVLSWIYAAFGKVDVVQAFFFGLKAAVRIAKRLRMKVDMPALGSINAPSLVLTLAALIAVFRFKLGMIKVLLACSLTGLLFYMVSGHAG